MTEKEIEKKAAQLASQIKMPVCITLSGDLGSGKTTFARSFIRTLCCDSSLFVPSPTFSLTQTYKTPNGLEIIHSDWYKISSSEEIFELGISFSSTITLIEWPEIAKAYLPKERMDIIMRYVDETHRDIQISNSLPI
jgi:tRNA threonylcarbamoyl adenosine modification protein YjeE